MWGRSGGRTPRTPIHFYKPINQIMSDTWRPWIGPRVLIPFAQNGHVSSPDSPHQPTNAAMSPPVRHRMDCTALPRHRTDCTDRYSQHQIFACLAWRTDRDIFSIRTPFEKVNIPPESGRRDGRNGTIFVAFRAL
jgi:hypothetical protein